MTPRRMPAEPRHRRPASRGDRIAERGRIAAIAALAALAALTIALASGCGQRTQLAGAPRDSSRIVPPDSAMRLLRDAQSGWEASGAGKDAAAASAAALLADLSSRRLDTWEGRTRYLLDSLAIGAEVADAPGALAVNFFSRSDPDAGSWPYLFWDDGKRARMEALEGSGLHLLSMAERRGTGTASGLAILFARRAAGGQQPLVMSWTHPRPEASWSLAQTLGPDSLGGIGTAEFQANSDSSADVVARTYTATRGFDECTMCPHIYRTRRFHWGAGGFARVEEQPVPSPYGSFVQFVQALMAGNEDAAKRRVVDDDLVDRARKLDWNQPKGLWRVAPETDETAQQMIFFRGKDEAYRVNFVQHSGEWLIEGFEPTSRTIE